MPLRPGDTLHLSISPTIWMTQFKALKPSGSIARVLGADPDADMRDMEDTLRVMVARACLTELGIVTDMEGALGSNIDLVKLADYCEGVIHDKSATSVRQSRDIRPASNRSQVPASGKRIIRKRT